MISGFQLQWEVSKQQAGRMIREFLKEEEISRIALTDIKYNGGKILVNDIEVNVRYILKEGEFLTVIFPPENPSEGSAGEKIPLEILFEDQYLLVVNKPAGMSTIPSREHPTGSLANALVGYYEEIGIRATSHIVTRLDRDTSGIVLIAKHRHVHHLLSKQQQNGNVKRTYEALAEGNLALEKGSIEEPIGRKLDSIIEREVRSDGQYSCTHYKVLKRYKEFTHVELQLKTGRTHQIRVHMSFIGHPLLGDDLYGGIQTLINRQALHCKKIQFPHPFSGKDMNFTSNLPLDMYELVKADS
ncbi:RluA family pseudouridine synthase [Bacillus sp. EB106-08-02-XG196]|uniref:RluA family pseudouridine synthase n=1 Tax=Bacillus sp. EB106-08-02-XG196 TaxID=2737049 RepID=UPI0015C44F1A|nr:RluA family pseudouridine synthase [Bacillus sp. EB106-08-02-XG196]NWQ41265.1 RluA family pseudouridine synthase [Bacillus sp. EB106-08-02-XG196]